MTVNVVIFILFSYSSHYPEQFVSAPTISKNYLVYLKFKNSTHNILILCRVEKMVWVVLFLCDVAGVMKITLNIPFKKVVLPGRVECGAMEGEIVVAHGCRKRKKLICGPEGEIVVAYGRLPFSARVTISVSHKFVDRIHILL